MNDENDTIGNSNMSKKSKVVRLFKDDKPSVAKAAFWYLLCQFLIRGMTFFTTPIFTRIMSQEEFGAISNFLSWQGLLYPLLTLNLSGSIGKAKYIYEDFKTFLCSIMTASSISTVIMGSIFLVLIQTEIITFNMPIMIFLDLLLYSVSLLVFNYQQSYYNVLYRYKKYVFQSVLYAFLSVGMSVILVLTMEDRIKARILGIVVPSVIIALVIYISVWVESRTVKKSMIVFAARFSIPLILSTLANQIIATSDKVMITNYCGERDNALYTVAYSVSSMASILWSALNQAWAPWLRDSLSRKEYGRISQFSKLLSGFYIAIIVFLMLIAPEIVLVMGGKQYMESVYVMPPVILSMVFQFFYAYYFEIEYLNEKPIIFSLGTMIAAIVNVVLNIWLIPMHGYIAAAYTTLCSYGIMFLYHFLIVKIRLKMSYVYDTTFIFGCLLVCFVIQFMVMTIYSNSFIRYALIVLYTVILLLIAYNKREDIKGYVMRFIVKK